MKFFVGEDKPIDLVMQLAVDSSHHREDVTVEIHRKIANEPSEKRMRGTFRAGRDVNVELVPGEMNQGWASRPGCRMSRSSSKPAAGEAAPP